MAQPAMPVELRVELLGPAHITRGGAPLSFARRKALALLAYLVMTGRPHSREALASLISDGSDAHAHKQFRNTLSDLHEQVGPYLVITRQTVAFDRTRPYWLDVEAATAALDTDDPDAFERSLAWLERELLTGFVTRGAPAFEDWLRGERQRLRDLCVGALLRALERAGGRGDILGAIAHGQRVLALEPWREEAHRALMRLLARSGQRSAALAQYEICRRTLAEELCAEPEAETTALYEHLRTTPLMPPHNLLPDTTPFFGRAEEVATLVRQLADPTHRLISIVGLGGSGKTRLALHTAAYYANRPTLDDHPFPDGVYLITLADARRRREHGPATAPTQARHVAAAIAQALRLGIRTADDPVTHLAGQLGTRRMLLVVDNGEVLLAGAGVLRGLLRRAPGVTVLVASRERLGLPGEWTLELGGLALPADPAQIELAPASRLFLEQVRQVAPDAASPAPGDREHILRICRLVQGLPLALVLAARWRRGMSYAEIAAELARGIDVLGTTDRALPGRQRTLRTVLAASWAGLAAEEQALLERLSIFHGGFTREAARAVAAMRPDQLLMLRDHALLEQYGDGSRYVLPELVRQYAGEQLAARPDDAAEAAARHAAYYATYLHNHAAALFQTPAAREAIDADNENVWAALEWAIAGADIGLLEQMRGGLSTWYALTGRYPDWEMGAGRAATRFRTALAAAVGEADPHLRSALGSVLGHEARAVLLQGQYDRAHRLLDEAAAVVEEAGDMPVEADHASVRALLLYRRGDLRAARQQSEEALALARTARVPRLEAADLWHLSVCARDAGDDPGARAYLERALVVYRALDDHVGEATIRAYQAALARDRGDVAVAQRLLEDTLPVFRAFRYRALEWFALQQLGLVYDELLGQHTVAEGYLTQALSIAQAMADRPGEAIIQASLGRNALYQGNLVHAQAAYQEAGHLWREMGGRIGESLAVHGLGVLAHYRGDEAAAQTCAAQALAVSRHTGHRRLERAALRLLGQALAGLGEVTRAAVAYQQALEMDRVRGIPHLIYETRMDLAGLALAQGNLDQAAVEVDGILDHLQGAELAGMEEPIRVYLICFRVLRAGRDPRATGVLETGHTLLRERAAQFAEGDQRRQFFTNIPAHRDLQHAWRAHRYAGAPEPKQVM